MILPAAEKTRSDGVDVAGTLSSFLAMEDNNGNR